MPFVLVPHVVFIVVATALEPDVAKLRVRERVQFKLRVRRPFLRLVLIVLIAALVVTVRMQRWRRWRLRHVHIILYCVVRRCPQRQGVRIVMRIVAVAVATAAIQMQPAGMTVHRGRRRGRSRRA